ncbi:FAD-dependent thymidylate synthase [Candidatus Pacearchaeota archaeon]|nr:FAD-dependent thymidylate synthase [Candidatus Pacearchaeota archaeon]
MKRGKLIVFEGADCSGKSTQINLLIEKLKNLNRGVVTLDFPNYSTPTGKIVRKYLDGEFGPANNIPAKVASVFYAEDRFASKGFIQDELDKGNVTILDRYVESNMGHQGGKIRNAVEREKFFEWLRKLEYEDFELPKPDAVVFLYMPYEVGHELMNGRERKSEFHPGAEKLDGHEGCREHMKNAEESYLHLAKLYGWIMINCAPDGTMESLKTPEEIHKELWEKLGGSLQYSEDEKLILDYFFTNLDSPIFAVKNFHPEVWALMQAKYSRSEEGLRESFLDLLKKEESNFDLLVEEIKNTKQGAATKYATDKAIEFMERWVLGYGHSSVAEGAVVGLGLEGVSILATKVIEDNRLCSFCEKSTRYVSFHRSSFYLDDVLKNSEYADEINEMLDFLFETYIKLHEPVLEYIRGVVPLKEGSSEVAWKKACASRRFDAIRYLLPTCTKTSLGWTVNARQLSHAISKLLSHPLKEMNDIGEKLKIEGGKVFPSLLRHSDRKDYLSQTQKNMQTFNFEENSFDGEKVKLVNFSENPESVIISSILYRYGNCSFAEAERRVASMNSFEREGIIDGYLGKMEEFDHPLRELEHQYFSFDIVMDYGAFRDLQRHRICTQTNPVFTSDLGYDVPNDIVVAGVEAEYRLAMEKAKEVYEKVREKYPLQAQYLLPLGFRKRFLITMNLRELHYLIKLRTTPMAHDSYRRIACKIYEILNERYPLLSKYIICNYSQEELGRLRAEEKTEAKRNLL